MNPSYISTSLRFAFGLICCFCFDVQTETINLFEKASGPIMLVTSAQIAHYNKNSSASARRAQKTAQQLCLKIGKKLSTFKTLLFEEEQLNQIHRTGIYKAYTTDEKLDGLAFVSADFPLAMYPKTSLAQTIESLSYGLAGISFVAGGLSTYLVWAGFEGSGDPQKALIFGCTTAALTGAGLLGGGLSWLYQKCIPHKNESSEAEKGTHLGAFALPILAQEIICE